MSRIKSKPAGIPWAKPFLSKSEERLLSQAFRSQWISDGPFVNKFEAGLTRKFKAAYALTTSSGTASLQLALLGLGISRGDEVIVPAYTFAAPANMAIAVGAKPVLVEVNPLTFCVEPDLVERKITPRTKVLIAVHPYGNVCDMTALNKIARKHKISIIEDAAEACLSTYKGKFAGTFGDIGCLSFQAAKTLTTGEGGGVLTSKKTLFERMKLIRNHGMRPTRRYWHEEVGHNFRLTNLQAAVGCAQLGRAGQLLRERQRVYNEYKRQLENIPGIQLQKFTDLSQPVVWALAIKIDKKDFGCSRERIIEKMLSSGIECRRAFYALSELKIFHFPRMKTAEDISRNVLCLPFYCEMTNEQVTRVCETLIALKKH